MHCICSPEFKHGCEKDVSQHVSNSESFDEAMSTYDCEIA